MEEFNFYVLLDPRTCKVRYIGRTTKKNLNNRRCEHISKSKYHERYGRSASAKIKWIKELVKEDLKPILKVIATITCDIKEARKLERFLINKYKFSRNLTNSDDRGGDEKNKIVDEEQKLKISKTLKEGYANGRIKSKSVIPIYVYDINGKFLNEYESITVASNQLKVSTDSISRQLNGKVINGKKGFRFSKTKIDSLPSLVDCGASIRTKVVIKTKETILTYGSLAQSLRANNIPITATGRFHVSKKLYKKYPNSKIYVNDELM